MQTDWYVIINAEDEVLSATMPEPGKLLSWKPRVGNKPMSVVLYPTPEIPEGAFWEWPEGVHMIHLSEL